MLLFQHNIRSGRARCFGLSLTELMVSTVLLATVTASGLTAFSRAHSARRDAGRLQQLHESAQYALASLEPELQLAGYFGISGPPAPLPVSQIPEPAQRCGPDVVRRLELPVQVLSTWSLSCQPSGGGAIPGSDVLIVRRLSARHSPAAEKGRAQWASTLANPRSGRLYWNGDAPSPQAVEYPVNELRDLLVRVYYVARVSDGDAPVPALRMKSLTSIAGVPAFIDTEVMPGVERLQVEVLPSATAPSAVRVRLRIRTSTHGLRGTTSQALNVERYFALRNAVS